MNLTRALSTAEQFLKLLGRGSHSCKNIWIMPPLDISYVLLYNTSYDGEAEGSGWLEVAKDPGSQRN